MGIYINGLSCMIPFLDGLLMTSGLVLVRVTSATRLCTGRGSRWNRAMAGTVSWFPEWREPYDRAPNGGNRIVASRHFTLTYLASCWYTILCLGI